jgi:hypothetical protein
MSCREVTGGEGADKETNESTTRLLSIHGLDLIIQSVEGLLFSSSVSSLSLLVTVTIIGNFGVSVMIDVWTG